MHSANHLNKIWWVSDGLGQRKMHLAEAILWRTKDSLLAQIKEVNQVMGDTANAWLPSPIYRKNLTDGILQLAAKLSDRYRSLTDSFTARSKSLQAAMEFNTELDEFLAWLMKVDARNGRRTTTLTCSG